MQISAKELRQLAGDVDDMHRDAMTTFREEAAELHFESLGGSRRRFLKNAGLAGAGAALITVGGPLSPFGPLFPAAAQGLTDTVIAGYAQSIELAAVAAYAAAAPALPSTFGLSASCSPAITKSTPTRSAQWPVTTLAPRPTRRWSRL